LKNHKSLNNGPTIKNYTIPGKKKVWKTQIHSQTSAMIEPKGPKRPSKIANLENIQKWPLNDPKATLRGQNDPLGLNGWFYWP
jgi:hypothetical protein